MNGVPEDKAVLVIYGGDKVTINGKSFKDYPHKGPGFMGAFPITLTLDPGEYTVVGDYSMTSAAGQKNNKFKGVSMTANLRGGYSYDMGIYTDERELAYAVDYVELPKSGWWVAYRPTEGFDS